MTTAHRDLASAEIWQRSLERSRYRRALAPKARREHARKKHVSAALATAVVAGPSTPLAAAQLSSDLEASVASESPASRAIELRAGGLPLMLGSQGDLVAHAQRALGIPADGIFGAQTDAAVRRFQYAAKLKVDGIIGPATWSALFATGRGAAVGGSNVPPQVKERVEQKLRAAEARLATEAGGGSTDDGWGSLGAPRTSAGGDAAAGGGNAAAGDEDGSANADGSTGGDVSGGVADDALPQAGAPVDGCGSAAISNPVQGTVTSGFGPRGGRNHDGLDIAAPTGTAVRAAACGTVSLAGQQGGYGNMVCITHTSQFSTCYAHLSRYAVSNGAAVQQGQVIGYVGCTGSCTGPHLHFETRVNGQAEDPRAYLAGGAVPGKPAATSASRAKKGGSSTRTAPAIGGSTATTAVAPAGGASTPAVTSTDATGTLQYAEPAAAEPAATQPAAAEPLATESAVPAEPVAMETAVPAEPVAMETAVPAEPVGEEPAAPAEQVAVETAAPAQPMAAETAVPTQPVAVETAQPVEPVTTPSTVPAAPAEPVPTVTAVPTAAPAAPVSTEPPAPVEPATAPVEPAPAELGGQTADPAAAAATTSGGVAAE
jgi:murein DD-endopeptidase MepM/ murein hydrolase activator NlpD